MRGVAALLVMVNHVRLEYFVKGIELDAGSQTPLNLLLFFVTSLGREAVVVFFVLSGYLVGGQAVIDARAGSFSLQRYSIARISRLYVVLLPALALTAALDYWFGTWRASNGLGPLVINLLFLQSIFGPTYGSNMPLWSLAVEWWFYVLFGLAVYVFARRGWEGRRVVASAVLLAIVVALARFQPYILFTLPLWLLGVAARVVPRPRVGRAAIIPIAAIFLFCVIVSNATLTLGTDYLVGVATAALLLFFRELPAPKLGWTSAGSTLAAISFTLYAIHYPLILALSSASGWIREARTGIFQWLQVGLIAAGVCGVSYGLYLLFERHTPAVRKWLNATLNPRVAATVTT